MVIFVEEREAVTAIVITQAIFAIIAALFWVARLETEITKECISIKFFPFHRTFRRYRWNDVSKATMVRGHIGAAMKTTGLRKIRSGLQSTHYSNTYKVWGNKGLQLTLTNRRTLLIGTQKAEELEATLYKIERLKNR